MLDELKEEGGKTKKKRNNMKQKNKKKPVVLVTECARHKNTPFSCPALGCLRTTPDENHPQDADHSLPPSEQYRIMLSLFYRDR